MHTSGFITRWPSIHWDNCWAPGAAPTRPRIGNTCCAGRRVGPARASGASKARGTTGAGLAQYLVAQGETVYEINPRWTAKQRRRARKPGKNDPLDAHAVASLVQAEAPTLPPVTAEDETAVLDLLVTEREAALAEATRLCNQLHQLLLQVDPAYATVLPSLRSAAGVTAVAAYRTETTDVLVQHRVAAIHRLAQRLQLVRSHAAALQRQIRALAAQRYAPLTRLHGVQLLTAGALAGILGPARRFRSEAQLAAHAGVAPLEASSAGRMSPPIQSRRQPATECHAAPHRDDAGARCPPARAYLARRSRRQDAARSDASAQTLPGAGDLAPVARMPACSCAPDHRARRIGRTRTQNERRTRLGGTQLRSPLGLGTQTISCSR